MKTWVYNTSVLTVGTILGLCLLLVGCLGTAPVVPNFPDPPGKMAMERCPDLAKVKDDPTLSDVSKTVVANYGEYYSCAVKSDIWIEWYNIQKQIFKDLKK